MRAKLTFMVYYAQHIPFLLSTKFEVWPQLIQPTDAIFLTVVRV
jgi:hypothetical protein